MTETTSKRLHSLDVFRGFVIAAMILVNTPGSWDYVYAPLEHAVWNGLTPTDFIFPFFLWIMGVSAAFSLKKYDYRFSAASIKKVAVRTVVLLLVGYVIGWLSRFLYRIFDPEFSGTTGARWAHALWNFDTARVMGVMTRLALCYLFLSLLVFCIRKESTLKWLCAGMLVAYAIVLLIGHGFEFSIRNVVGRVDRALIPDAHLYHGLTVDGVSMTFDPEGILSTIPSVAQTLIGFLCGRKILTGKDNSLRVRDLSMSGTWMLLIGWLLSYGVPINKNVWSPTFVLVTSGAAYLCLALLIWSVDEKEQLNHFVFFDSFGRNAMFLFVLSNVVSLLLMRIPVWVHGDRMTLWNACYECIFCRCVPNLYLASLLQAILFVIFMWGISYVLYRKEKYIKI